MLYYTVFWQTYAQPKGKRMDNTLPIPLDIPNVKVLTVKFIGDEIHITVESTVTSTRCRKCGKQLTTSCGHDRERVLRHLAILGRPTFIHIRPLRFECRTCRGNPTTTQRLPWYDSRSPHTQAYEDYLLLQLRGSTVSDVELKEAIGYEAIMGIVERRIAKRVDWKRIKRLELLGVDEITLKKGHQDYVTLITGRSGNQALLLAVLGNREKATVKAFFASIPKRLRKHLRAVCTDMYEGFINAAKEVFSKKIKLVVDRFHVAKLYRGAVDDLRKAELKRLKKQLPEAEYKHLKGAMWALRRSLKKRTPVDVQLLRRLFQHSPLLETAYYASGILTHIFDHARSKRSARHRLQRWIYLVNGSGLTCFDKFLKTLDKWMEEILNYFVHRDSSGFVEGLNNKIKVIKRRCYGIFNIEHLFQRISLDLGNHHDLQENTVFC
jgi:transposase